MQPPAPAARLMQQELGFHVSQQVVPVHGYPNVYQIRVSLTPRTGEEQLTTADVARDLGISVRQASRLISRGLIRSHRPGLLHRRVYRRDLDAYRRAHDMGV